MIVVESTPIGNSYYFDLFEKEVLGWPKGRVNTYRLLHRENSVG